jgi:MFS family permease
VRLTDPLVRVAVATGLASIGLAAGGTGGALLATQLASDASVAGLPFGAVVAGSALGAVFISRLTLRAGRARALTAGYAIGVGGAVVVVVAALTASLPLLLAGSFLLGPANASVFLARYAGADLVDVTRRGRGLGTVLFATAFGALLAPNLLGPSGAIAEALGLSPYAGLYLVAFVAFACGGALVGSSSLPQPRTEAAAALDTRPRSARGPLVLGAANAAMVGIMAVAPVHMAGHGHDLGAIGLVISIHVAGMFAPSPLTGWASDRIGPAPVAVAGGALFVMAAAWGAVAEPTNALAAAGFLLVLGLGWNLAVVAGSAMLTAGLPADARPRAEATGEVFMGIAGAIGAMGAGILASASGWGTMMVVAGLIGALFAGGLVGRPRRTVREPATPSVRAG